METRRLYFAYGSNLHLQQMKRRCPESKYVGTGRLMDYRWQINERGYANVVPADGFWVDGLCYDISISDEARLDISEGVAKGAYEKKQIAVEIRQAAPALYRRPTAWIVAHGGVKGILDVTADEPPVESPTTIELEVLVYVSESFVTIGKPWDEYVDRINLGLMDAELLGLDPAYIANCIRPFIPEGSPSGQFVSEESLDSS
ncbi:gamma-glutamyl cyclotransferase, AIG2-like domain-containing protein [Sarocladium implicatum]|nr:gamma-glutamyl cyclotransferase, AIG2-like domain-containing protein [Sarocladium implicatum]